MITTIGAIGFAIQSHNKQIKLEAASLWTPLDFNCSPIINVTKKQSSGLRELESADEAPKLEFFDQLMKDPAFAERFINNPEVIMTAMVGISPTRKNELLDRLNKPLAQGLRYSSSGPISYLVGIGGENLKS